MWLSLTIAFGSILKTMCSEMGKGPWIWLEVVLLSCSSVKK